MQLGEARKIRFYPTINHTLKEIERMAWVKYFNPSITEARFPRLLEGGASVRTATFPKEFSTEHALSEIENAGLTAGLFDHWVGLLLDAPSVAKEKPLICLGSSHTFMPDGEIRYPVAASNPHWQGWLLLAVKVWDPCYDVIVVEPD